MGAMSDPYNPFEKKYKLTQGALKLISRHEYGLALSTKSNLITRDKDLIREISKKKPVIIKITVTTADDGLCRKIEPFVSLSSERFQAIRVLSEAGIYTGVLMMPLLPFIEDTPENITEIVEQAHSVGAKFIYPAFGSPCDRISGSIIMIGWMKNFRD
jgi:DNA repair photolyase